MTACPGARRTFDLINAICRSATPEDMQRFRGELYVMAADIGGAPPFEGRAGWTWYTGAAGWAWRLAVEGILGLEMRDGALRIAPCLPQAWSGFRTRVQGPAGAIDVTVRQAARVTATKEDIRRPEDGAFRVDFSKDGSTHRVEIEVPRGAPAQAAMQTVQV